MEIFHGYSHLMQAEAEKNVASGVSDDDDRDVNEDQSFEAVMEGLRKWNVDLTEAEEEKIRATYFKEQWNIYRDPYTNNLKLGDSVNLFRSIVKDISGTLNPYYN